MGTPYTLLMFATRATPAVRLWAAAATVLAAAVPTDVLTEALSNAGLLGAGALRDGHQESAAPVALLAAAVLFTLVLFVALRARVAPAVQDSAPPFEWILWGAGMLGATLLAVLLMEAYETRLGGVGAFDPHGVLVVHAPAALLACATAGALVNRLVAFVLQMAHAAGIAVSHHLVRFLERGVRGARLTSHRVARAPRIVHRELVLARRAHHLRAPPEWSSLALHSIT